MRKKRVYDYNKKPPKPPLTDPVANLSHDEFWAKVDDYTLTRVLQIGTSQGGANYGRLRNG